MTQIKKGQKVRILNNEGNGFKVGQIVEVLCDQYPGAGTITCFGPVRDTRWNSHSQYVANGKYELVDPLDLSKSLETVAGVQFTLITTEGRGEYPILGYVGERTTPDAYDQYGEPFGGHPAFKLRNVKPKLVETEGYGNIYKDADGGLSLVWHPSRKEADRMASSSRVSRMKLELVEGQWDE